MMFILALCLFWGSLCDSVESGYENIKPLHTSRGAVEKLLGKPTVDEHGYRYRYPVKEGFVDVIYSSEPCKDSKYGLGEFNIPADTVLSYRVLRTDHPKVTEVQFDRDKFPKHGDYHLLTYFSYVNADNSVAILTMTDETLMEYVYEIEYEPTKEDIESFKCK
jgi:hypothetical protein